MEKLVEKITTFFTFFFSNFIYEYSEEWDNKINELLKTEEPFLGRPNCIDGQYYTIHLGDVQIWIQNYPYGFGKQYINKGNHFQTIDVRPSKTTIRRLKKIADELKRKERFKKRVDINNFKLLRNNQIQIKHG